MSTRFLSESAGRWAVLLLLLGWLPIGAGAGAAAFADELVEWEERAMRAAVARVAGAVVRVDTIGGQERVGRFLVAEAPTTGLIVSEDGLIVSSAFNFVQQPASILVTLADGTRLPAEIVARDRSCMLVLLKVSLEQPLEPPAAVPLEEMQVGQWALAVGRTFDQQQPSLSAGILSAKNRIWSKAIQTDAKISPRNYGGPLIDIRGRVLGVLVPLSPDGQSELAGAEWYDSGIGFAIPLDEIYQRLDRFREGDLHPGLLGITLGGQDIYSSAAEIAACQPRSPAQLAGLQAGDVIVEFDGEAIQRQAQLKHALGRRYAGDEVPLVVLRDGERLEASVTLAEELLPYEHPFLGVLPQRRQEEEPGVAVRFTYPGSGADEAGIQAGDRILEFNGEPVADPLELRSAVANLEPGDLAALELADGQETRKLEVKLGRLPVDVPQQVPDVPPEGEPDAGQPPVGEIEVTIPEEPNSCFAYVSPRYDAQQPCGLLLLLAPPGEADHKPLIAAWKEVCDQRNLILAIPQPSDASRWQPTEVQFLRKVVDYFNNGYQIDPPRVVVMGQQAGGAMAYLAAFRLRDHVRGLIAMDAAMPQLLQPPDNDPIQRLAIYTTLAAGSPLAQRVEAGAKLLAEKKFPVTVKQLDSTRPLLPEERDELGRWIDTLDRI